MVVIFGRDFLVLATFSVYSVQIFSIQ